MTVQLWRSAHYEKEGGKNNFGFAALTTLNKRKSWEKNSHENLPRHLKFWFTSLNFDDFRTMQTSKKSWHLALKVFGTFKTDVTKKTV